MSRVDQHRLSQILCTRQFSWIPSVSRHPVTSNCDPLYASLSCEHLDTLLLWIIPPLSEFCDNSIHYRPSYFSVILFIVRTSSHLLNRHA